MGALQELSLLTGIISKTAPPGTNVTNLSLFILQHVVQSFHMYIHKSVT